MNLLSISGDSSTARGLKGPHYHLLEEYHKYWGRLDILVPHHPDAKEQTLFGNVHLHIAPESKFERSKFIEAKGLELIKDYQHQIITVHDYPPFLHGKAARALTQKTKVPHVLEIFHVEGYPKAVNATELFRRMATSFYIQKVHPAAKAIRVINKKQVPSWLNKRGVPEEKILLLYSTYIDFDVFKKEELEKKYDLIHIGRLVENKGIFDLLKALKDNQQLTAIIVGTGPLENKIKKYIHKHKLSQRVTLSGWVENQKDVVTFINQSRALVCCSRSEGGPRTTLEAMACEIPVITTAVGTMPDIIKHRENACLIDFDVESLSREINFLLGDAEQAKKMGQEGRKAILGFEKKTLVKNMAETYQKLALS